MTPGEAYFSVMSAAHSWVVVGSHDPAGSVSIVQSGGFNQNWISVPYHPTATVAGDLWTEINADTGNAVSSVNRWVASGDTIESWSGRAGTNFAITPGMAIMCVASSGTGTWTPEHY